MNEQKRSLSATEETLLEDLVRRARGGIVIYPFVWLITALWAEIYSKNPFFFWINSLFFLLLIIFRTGFDIHFSKRKQQDTKKTTRILVTLILASGIHWGMTSVWIIFVADYAKLHYVYIIILAALACGGTATLSIAREIRLLYPFFIFGPSMVGAVIIGGGENYVLVILATLTIVYILDASRVSARDYFRANYHRALAEKRNLRLVEEIESRRKTEKELEKLISELQEALAEVKTLRGILPICSHCKKIRDDQGYWNKIESYLNEYSEARFSHGLCPECTEELYGQELWYKKHREKE